MFVYNRICRKNQLPKSFFWNHEAVRQPDMTQMNEMIYFVDVFHFVVGI